MTRQQAVEFVRELEVGVNAHDTARLMRMYTDEAVAKSPMFPLIEGRAAIEKSWDTLFSLFPNWAVEISEVLVDGDRIAFMGRAGATDRNGWFGQPATGEAIEYRVVVILDIVDGKIVRDERVYDLAGVLQRLEKARLDKELRMAAEIQRILLSRRAHRSDYCEAVADSIPCLAIGGDFFELVRLPSGSFGIALGDVGGKGPASALVASMIQGMLVMEVEHESSPSSVFGRLNRMLVPRGLEPRFATLVYGVLSPDGQFVYSNARHTLPVVLSKGRTRRLKAGGPALGMFLESQFAEETVCLGEGDSVVLHSDGITEARDAQDQEFGDQRLISCIAGASATSAADMLARILAAVQDFCRGAPQTDDISAAVLRLKRSR
jgi:ketosteroid isomerase-like protein